MAAFIARRPGTSLRMLLVFVLSAAMAAGACDSESSDFATTTSTPTVTNTPRPATPPPSPTLDPVLAVEERLRDHFLFVDLPADARQVSWGCRAGDSLNNPLCRMNYATGERLSELLGFYRQKFTGDDWQRLIDNQQRGTRYVWTLSWSNDIYSLTMDFQEAERSANDMQPGEHYLVWLTVVERPR
jgi:hypothetical protein